MNSANQAALNELAQADASGSEGSLIHKGNDEEAMLSLATSLEHLGNNAGARRL